MKKKRNFGKSIKGFSKIGIAKGTVCQVCLATILDEF